MIEFNIWDGKSVTTSDGIELGVARSLHYRPADEVNPAQQLYAVYLKIVNYELGDELFIPVEFLDAREGADAPLSVSVPLKVVMQRAWSRAPDFVAKRLGREERLPGAEANTATHTAPGEVGETPGPMAT